jgi:hypothetical protein
MKEEDVQFLFDAIININSNEWRVKEENVSRLIELTDTYGGEVVDAKIQQIKEVLNERKKDD